MRHTYSCQRSKNRTIIKLRLSKCCPLLHKHPPPHPHCNIRNIVQINTSFIYLSRGRFGIDHRNWTAPSRVCLRGSFWFARPWVPLRGGEGMALARVYWSPKWKYRWECFFFYPRFIWRQKSTTSISFHGVVLPNNCAPDEAHERGLNSGERWLGILDWIWGLEMIFFF